MVYIDDSIDREIAARRRAFGEISDAIAGGIADNVREKRRRALMEEEQKREGEKTAQQLENQIIQTGIQAKGKGIDFDPTAQIQSARGRGFNVFPQLSMDKQSRQLEPTDQSGSTGLPNQFPVNQDQVQSATAGQTVESAQQTVRSGQEVSTIEPPEQNIQRTAADRLAQIGIRTAPGFQTQADKDKAKAKQQSFKNTSELRKEWRKTPTTKITEIATQQSQKINQAARAGTAQGDLSLVFAFMKMLDPNSVVRESEYAAAADTRGLFEEAKAIIPKLQSGETLPPEQRARFVELSNKFAEIQKNAQKDVNAFYAGIAERNGFDTRDIIQDFEFNLTDASDRSQFKSREGSGFITETEKKRLGDEKAKRLEELRRKKRE